MTPRLLAAAVGMLSLLYGWLVISLHANPAIIGLAVMPFVAAFLLARPRYVLYLLVAAAAALDDMLMPWLPLSRGVGELSQRSLDWLFLTPLEILIILGLVGHLLGAMKKGGTPFRLGAFFWPMAPFLAFVLMGLAFGLMGGGDRRIAFFELRSLLYVPALYLLFYNTIRTKAQLNNVVWIVLLGVGINALLGSWTYFVVLGRNLSNVVAITSHVQGVFLGMLFLFAVAQALYRGSKWKWAILFPLVPFALISFVATDRRSGYGAVVIGFVGLLCLAYRDNKRAVIGIAVAATIGSALYAGAFWNSSSFVARPLQGIKSIDAQPGEYRYGSNYARVLEKWDIVSTIHRTPLLGVGFGNKFDMPVPILYYDSPLREYIPHESVFWVWLKTGVGGFVAFLVLIGLAVTRAAHIYRRIDDRHLKPPLAVCLLFIPMFMVFAYADHSWEFKGTFFLGAALGSFAVVARMLPHAPEELRRRDHGR